MEASQESSAAFELHGLIIVRAEAYCRILGRDWSVQG